MSPKNSGKIIKSVNEGKAWDWGELLSELKQGNDRATAILGGVFLDEQLRELLA